MNPKTLVTAFKPFLHHSLNCSEILLMSLQQERRDIEALFLPVSFENSFVEFKKHWLQQGPYKSVLMLGQANGRKAISLERVALNWKESKNPDNDGECPPGGRILNEAPDSYLVDFFPSEWRERLAVEISLTAGAYVCNTLYFRVTHELRETGIPALFAHLPLLPEQVTETPESPSLDLATQKRIIHRLLDLMVDRAN
jgi:pyroglutamyl-peptidase